MPHDTPLLATKCGRKQPKVIERVGRHVHHRYGRGIKGVKQLCCGVSREVSVGR